MGAQQSASRGNISVLQGATYFMALLTASTAALLAYVSSVPAYLAFGLTIAAVIVLLAHQPISRMTVASVVLVTVAFIAPATLVHVTYSSAGCVDGVPCDPAPNAHEGLRFGLAGVLLCAGLLVALIGLFLPSRRMHPRRRARG
jgi:lysylphosphatidylglycerol synthetase-like protein (DUF2156 family)